MKKITEFKIKMSTYKELRDNRRLNLLIVKYVPKLKEDYDDEKHFYGRRDYWYSGQFYSMVFKPYLRTALENKDTEEIIKCMDLLEYALAKKIDHNHNTIGMDVTDWLGEELMAFEKNENYPNVIKSIKNECDYQSKRSNIFKKEYIKEKIIDIRENYRLWIELGYRKKINREVILKFPFLKKQIEKYGEDRDGCYLNVTSIIWFDLANFLLDAIKEGRKNDVVAALEYYEEILSYKVKLYSDIFVENIVYFMYDDLITLEYIKDYPRIWKLLEEEKVLERRKWKKWKY